MHLRLLALANCAVTTTFVAALACLPCLATLKVSITDREEQDIDDRSGGKWERGGREERRSAAGTVADAIEALTALRHLGLVILPGQTLGREGTHSALRLRQAGLEGVTIVARRARSVVFECPRLRSCVLHAKRCDAPSVVAGLRNGSPLLEHLAITCARTPAARRSSSPWLAEALLAFPLLSMLAVRQVLPEEGEEDNGDGFEGDYHRNGDGQPEKCK